MNSDTTVNDSALDIVSPLVNENLENNPNKAVNRVLQSEQIYSAGFRRINGIILSGCTGLFDKMLIARAESEKIPVHIDSVEYDIKKVEITATSLQKYIQDGTCTVICDDVFDVMDGHVIERYGFGYVKGERKESEKYNVLYVDLCGRPSKGIINTIVSKWKKNGEDKSILYATFQISGSRVEDGKAGLISSLGYTPKTDVSSEDVREAIVKRFQETFSDYRMATNTVLIYNVVYSGGTHSIMITIGFARNIRNIKKVEENWTNDIYDYHQMATSNLKRFQKWQRKVRGKKIGLIRKTNERKKHREIKKLELERKHIVKSAIRILGKVGWSNSKLSKTFNMPERKVGSIMAWTTGKLALKDKFINYFKSESGSYPNDFVKVVKSRLVEIDSKIEKGG